LTSVKEVSFFLHIKKSEIKVTDKEQKKWNEKLEDLLIKVEKEVAGGGPPGRGKGTKPSPPPPPPPPRYSIALTDLRLKNLLFIAKQFQQAIPERRWSSRTFQYGYLVTTSLQSLALPSASPSDHSVGATTSGMTSSHSVTGGVYKARERIHRRMADRRLLAIPPSCRRVAACNPN
jgi:hypothetical protein